ncbi:MAG: sugar transferase [Terracidiphilus sp.]
MRKRLSPWSRSTAKRVFDCACVVAALPLLVPTLVAIALTVRWTSRGPVLFLQQRVGRHGRVFTIFKFRTMAAAATNHTITTATNQQFTPIGRFLRRWKMDELPQLLNVLFGDMSLVGPRPKMLEHVAYKPLCRPGITGAATLVFAREESMLDQIPKHRLQDYFHDVVLPAKRRLDAEYMEHATFLSDLKLIVNSVLRRWDPSAMQSLIGVEVFQDQMHAKKAPVAVSPDESALVRVMPHLDRPIAAE